MKKINTIIWTLFILSGVRLSVLIIMNDKERILFYGAVYFIVCLALQVLEIKEERENSLKYIKR